MDDPGHLNALGLTLTVQLLDGLSALETDPEIRAIVLTGADPAFSAGGDLRAMQQTVHGLVDRSPEGATAMWRWIRYQFGGVVRLITRSDKVFVAAINGAAAGVGLAFALACDLLVASEQARLVLAFGRIGLVPEVGTSWLLTRRLGYQKTFELFLSGEVLSAREAERLGLVNEVVAPGSELDRALEWCERAGRLPAHALAMTKPLLRGAADMTWEQAIAMEEFAEPMCFTTRAHRDTVRGMLDKRSPGDPEA
jgi:2-(1,2-epoxy-1,2-dihydrophenyl)acetyl-CoA isomerase